MDWNKLAYINNDTTILNNDEEVTMLVKLLERAEKLDLKSYLTGVSVSCCNNGEVTCDCENYRFDELSISIMVLKCQSCGSYIIDAQDF